MGICPGTSVVTGVCLGTNLVKGLCPGTGVKNFVCPSAIGYPGTYKGCLSWYI